MAWNEQLDKRTKYAKTWRDSEDSSRFRVFTKATPLHYEGVLDSNVFDTQVDFTAQRVITPNLDGWRVTQNGWHFGIGERSDGRDGWVGFGGRQGSNWLYFRLERAAWLRWSSRNVTNIGGEATYNRANLSVDTGTVDLPDGTTVNTGTTVTWSNLWNGVDVRWKASGDKLKEEIVVSQAARDTLANTYPGGPQSDMYLTFAFRLDATDIPKWLKNGIQQNLSGDFDDDTGTSGFQLTDSLDRLLAFMPVDDAIVYNELEEEIGRQRLRKRIYNDGNGNIWLIVGIRADQLNSLPSGTLIFDPTIDQQVSASADDAHEAPDFSQYSYTATFANFSNVYWAGARFPSTGVPQGATIDVAYVEWWFYATSFSNMQTDVYCEDVDTPDDYATTQDLNGRTLTTATVYWNNNYNQQDAFLGSDTSLVGPVQEVVNRASFSGTINFIYNSTARSGNGRCRTYDQASDVAPQLHIEYTTGVSDPTISVSDSLTVGESVSVSISTPPGADLSVSTSDSLSLSEQTEAFIETSVDSSDSLSIIEEIDANLVSSVSTADSINLSEQTDVSVEFFVSVSDSLSLSETLDTYIETYVSASESIGVTESTSVLIEGSSQTQEIQVSSGPDDAHELGNGTFSSNHTWLNLYAIQDTDTTSEWYRSVGVRFQGLNIPQGATVTNAYLSFHTRLAASVNCTIYAEDVDDAVDFSTNADILSRTRTTASVSWSQQSQSANTWYDTPDLTSAVQEVVDRVAYSSGNDIVFLLIATVSSAFQAQQEFYSYENSTTLAPKIFVEYTIGDVTSVSISESVSVSESIQLETGDLQTEVSDSLAVAEVVLTSVADNEISVTDSLSLSEAVNTEQEDLGIQSSDSITLNESVSISIQSVAPLTVGVIDGMTITESISNDQSDQFARPILDISAGNWTTDSGATTNLFSVLDEESANDTDYIQSETDPVTSTVRLGLNGFVDPEVGEGHIVRYRYRKDPVDSDQVDLIVRLIETSTVRATWTHTNISDTWSTAEQTLTAGEANSITDYTVLRIEFEANKP